MSTRTTLVSTLHRIAPQAHENYLQALERGTPLLEAEGITTPLRLTHFLAQALHETAGLSILRENLRYSPARMLEIFGPGRHSASITPAEASRLAGNEPALAERVYGLGNPSKARELGNTQPGDGYRFRGNGLLQITGRANHQRAGLKAGIDLERHPELATHPDHALEPSLCVWRAGNLNRFADTNDLRAVTRWINGGYNGLQDRQRWFDRLWPLLQDPETPSWAAARPSSDTRWLQETLNALGQKPPLKVDGRFGPATRSALEAFQRAHQLLADGVPGPITLKALHARLERK